MMLCVCHLWLVLQNLYIMILEWRLWLGGAGLHLRERWDGACVCVCVSWVGEWMARGWTDIVVRTVRSIHVLMQRLPACGVGPDYCPFTPLPLPHPEVNNGIRTRHLPPQGSDCGHSVTSPYGLRAHRWGGRARGPERDSEPSRVYMAPDSLGLQRRPAIGVIDYRPV